MTDADELRRLAEQADKWLYADHGTARRAFVAACSPATVLALLDDRDRLAAENADLKAVKVAYEEAPKDARNATTAGVTWETLQGTVGRAIDSQTIRDLRAENARLRAALEMAEWGAISFDGARDRCSVCGAVKSQGHFPGCAVAAALTRKEG